MSYKTILVHCDASRSVDGRMAVAAELAQRFGARGTPAVFLADGNTIGGLVPAEKIEQALNSITPK